jgi:hypothetical protein
MVVYFKYTCLIVYKTASLKQNNDAPNQQIPVFSFGFYFFTIV